ncbi:MAG: hypothetical protein U9R24_07050 [Thermodesulfobacteriota bacterium]|nr:hypothetical protein [Thermodesulfobacteriota bacterium]
MRKSIITPLTIIQYLLILWLAFGIVGMPVVWAEEGIAPDKSASSKDFPGDIDAEWGGYIKCRGVASWPDYDSFYSLVGAGTYYDGSAEGRLKNRLYFGTSLYFDTHYEIILSGGDRRRNQKKLERLFAGVLEEGYILRKVEDDRRLLDLTKAISDDDDYIFYHRLDRLSLTIQQRSLVVRLGRQAVTWGNGFLFNPMDLFNPFAPTDTEREYKVGDDMALAQFSLGRSSDVQLLYVPRRDPSTGDLESDQSSFAGKMNFAKDTTEFDIMAAHHFEDDVVGVGFSGYLGDTAWRLDATWTFLDEKRDKSDFFSLVANMDYSWVWWEKNFYGFFELFYNGLGDDRYFDSLFERAVAERLDRGELFTLGRCYLAGHIRMEIHPLVNVFFTVVNNADDPSGILQPRLTWDVTQDLQFTCGGNIFYGGRDTEYGGFRIPPIDILIKSPDSTYMWLAYYF